MSKHELLIIGAGPGGYVAAIRAAQLGMDVACVDENDALGGTCLRVGCIPSKAMLESSHHYHAARHDLKQHGVNVAEVSLDLAAMLKRKNRIVETLTKGIDGLFRKNKITRYKGRARFDAPDRVVIEGEGETKTVEAERVIIATGSVPASLPGVEIDGERIGTSTEALSYSDVPKNLIVIGAGYIGLELGSVWSRLGSKVTVLEFLDRVLPGMDGETAQAAHKIYAKQGLDIRLQMKVTAAKVRKDKCIVECEGAEPLEADRVLVAVGRKPNTQKLGLDKIGVNLDDKGFVIVDGDYQTSARGVYAIGDVIGGAMLAHKAEEEGVACIEKLAGSAGHVEYGVIPAVVFTYPEIASVGRTEEQLKDRGTGYRKGVFPFQANGRARTLGESAGQVKILADERTDRVLGVHIIGPNAGELIAEAAAAMQFGASSEDIARTCHSHPTLAEAIKEAALAVDGRALHI